MSETDKKLMFQILAAYFPPDDIEWRVGQAGMTNGNTWAKVFAYITNRAIMNRLDEAVGPENWRNQYAPGPLGGVLCGISIRVGDEWITKWDGADNTDMEAVKGGLSDSMKRAAVHWGIGRYLYDLPEGWAKVHDKGKHYASVKIKENGNEQWMKFRWDPPELPSWAVPAGTAPPPPKEASAPKEPPASKRAPAKKSKEEPQALTDLRTEILAIVKDPVDFDALALWLSGQEITSAKQISSLSEEKIGNMLTMLRHQTEEHKKNPAEFKAPLEYARELANQAFKGL